MAPICEKRSQLEQEQQEVILFKGVGGTQPCIHSHGHHHHGHHNSSHTKEKTNNVIKHSKKGLEILDFHESWLEEMEIYKDQIYVQRQNIQQQQEHHLFGSHHRLQTPLYSNNANIYVSNNSNHNASIISGSNSVAITNAASNYDTLTASNSSNTKRKSAELGNINKSRIVVRNVPSLVTATTMSTLVTSAATDADSKLKVGDTVQLLLKRPRETSDSKSTANNSKRHHAHLAHSHAQSHSSSTTPKHGQNTAKSGNAIGIAVGSSTSKPQSNKIIVNQFHASSLLSSHQNGEKSKILAQSGLTKSAATAYETSMYASHYLPQENRIVISAYNSARHNNEYYSYVGVSLANGGTGAIGGDRSSHEHSGSPTGDDDPCAAIDDVNDYSDSESDEEYIGYPFYLRGDDVETLQSRNIHQEITSQSSVSENEGSEPSVYYKPMAILSPSLFPNVPPYLNFSSHVEKGPSMPPTLHKVLKWKLSPVMPKIVKRVVLNSGFRIIKNTTDWMAVWEKHMKSPGFRTIRSHQKYNHMPGSFRIGRKDTMWRSIHSNMKKFGSKEFGFMQKSYVMPDDLESLRQIWPKHASKLTKWIVKPPASARGTGIRIVNKWSQFPKDRPLVVQKYIERPLLINDNKFDMRIYVVVTSINPLRIYMHKDGLARFASVKYSSELNSLDDRCMHLTNYSINKFSQNYSKNEDVNACQGHKWTLQSLWSCLESRGVNTKRLWATLRNLVIKAIVSGESGLNRMYRQNVNFRYNCFELFGFDVLLDENLVPWLLEINISPSLHSELPLDLHVKGPLIQAVLNTALYQVPPKLNEKQQKDILEELNLEGPLCHDKRIFTTCLTTEEVRKHNQFTNRSIEFREEYLESILENLLPDDVRCLIVSEDEFARCIPLERIFPTTDTHIYLKFIDNPRYYNRLLDAWENKYGNCREDGIALLSRLCADGYHLHVSDAALEKEPDVVLTEIDMLHVKKSDDTLVPLIPPSTDSPTDGDSANASKASTPESIADSVSTLISSPVTCSKEASERSLKASKVQTTNAKSVTVKAN